MEREFENMTPEASENTIENTTENTAAQEPAGAPSAGPEPEQKKKSGAGKTVLTLVLAAAISLGCGYGGGYMAGQNAGRVVIQKAETDVSSAGGEESGLSATEVVQQIYPTVVSITTEQVRVNQFWFGTQIASGAGSGVIISEDGYILTCAHVVSGADSVMVATSDGTEYPAQVVGIYEDGDIAVLKIDAQGLQAAVLGDSSQLQLGEEVYAVGNPGGTLSGTVTDGIISATNRTISVQLEDGSQSGLFGSYGRVISLEVIQTNAAVSPGNSGGGLFNSRGELIGIVNAKSSGENQEGLGFAIPINTAQEIASSLIDQGSYIDPDAVQTPSAALEISVVEIDQSMAQMAHQTAGVYVQSVTEGGASEGLLEAGDRVISMNEQVVNTIDELTAVLAECSPGDTATLSVEREGRLVTVEVVLAENTAA